MEYDAVIEKYREYKLQESTTNLTKLTNGATSVEELLEYAHKKNTKI